MNKIRKFKINPHYKDIVRRVMKTQADLKGAGLSDDAALVKFINDFALNLMPGVVYRFFDGASLELEAAGISNKEMFSVCIVTLGRAVEDAAENYDAAARRTLAQIAFFDFLRTAVYFVSDLVKDLSEKEEFTTDSMEVLHSPSFTHGTEPKFLKEAARASAETSAKVLPVLFEMLNAAKIDVEYNGGEITPKGTIVFLIPWQKKKKKKK